MSCRHQNLNVVFHIFGIDWFSMNWIALRELRFRILQPFVVCFYHLPLFLLPEGKAHCIVILEHYLRIAKFQNDFLPKWIYTVVQPNNDCYACVFITAICDLDRNHGATVCSAPGSSAASVCWSGPFTVYNWTWKGASVFQLQSDDLSVWPKLLRPLE